MLYRTKVDVVKIGTIFFTYFYWNLFLWNALVPSEYFKDYSCITLSFESAIRKYNFDINIFRIYIKYAGYRGDEERAKIARKYICKRKRKKETEFEPSL